MLLRWMEFTVREELLYQETISSFTTRILKVSVDTKVWENWESWLLANLG